MKKPIFTIIQACFLVLALGYWQTGFSQVSISTHNTDFNTDLNGWNGTLPNGFTRTGANYVGTSASTSGGVYAVAGSGFGYQPSSTSPATSCTITGTFKNTTGSAITSLQISYDAFQIVYRASRLPGWAVTSSVGAVSGLNWSFNTSTSAGSPDNLSVTLTGLNIADNATFTLTFSSDRGTGSGSSPMIGLNNIKVRSILAAVCDDPTNLAENNVTANTADFNWDADGSNNFEYVLDQSASTPPGAGTAINGISYSTSSLLPSTTYYFHLRQNCGAGFSNWVYVNFTTPSAPCDAPTGLIAENTTHDFSSLSWNPQGSNGFEYVLDQTATDPTAAGTPITDTTYDATGLTPSTTYYMHVRTDCGSGNYSPWVTIPFTTLVEPCDAPTGLTSTNTTHNSSDLLWNAQGSSSFEYIFDQSPADPAVAGTPTTDTTYNATMLTPLTTYYLHLRADCGSGNYSQWITLSFTTLIEPCDAPTGLADANTTHNSSDLSWNTQGSNSFEYVVDQTATDPAAAGTATTDTTYNATMLDPSTTYYLHVRTDCGNGNYSPWVTIPFTTLVEPCDAPTGLADANTTSNSSDLSWNAQGSNSFEYVVDQTATDPTAAGTATTDTTYSATMLDGATTYYLHVRTDCGNGNYSPWVTVPFTTLVEPCDAPTGLADANTTSNSSDLSWNAQGSNSFEYVVDQTATDPTAAGAATTDTTYSATMLNGATTYYLHVRTDCGNGNYSPWVTIPFTTLAEPCDAPTGLTVSNITGHGANLAWTQTGGTFEYILNQSSGDPSGNGLATSNNTYTATSLTGESNYYFHVRTDCGNGNYSDWTSIPFTTLSTLGITEQTVVTLGAYPNPAQNMVTITGQTQGTITLNNLKGQKLLSLDLEQSSTLDLSSLESGIYFLVYTSESKSALIKLIKQ